MLAVALLLVLLPLGLRWPGLLLTGCLFTFQAGAIANMPELGSIYVAAAAAISLVRTLIEGQQPKLNSVDLGFWAFIGVCLLSSLHTPDSDIATTAVIHLAASTSGMYVIGRLQPAERLERSLAEFLWGVVVVAPLMGILLLTHRDLAPGSLERLVVGEASAVGISQPLPLALTASVLAMLLTKKPLWSILAAVSFGFTLYVSTVSATRGVFLSATIGVLVIVITLRPREHWIQYMWILAVGALAVVAVTVLLPSNQLDTSITRLTSNHHFGNLSLDPSSRNRIYAHEEARRLFYDAPLYGKGLGGYTALTGIIYPHNIFFEVAADVGIIGLIALGAYLFTTARAVWAARTQIATGTATIIGALFVTSLAHMQVSFALFMAHPMFLLTGVAAVAASRFQTRRAQPPPAQLRRGSWRPEREPSQLAPRRPSA